MNTMRLLLKVIVTFNNIEDRFTILVNNNFILGGEGYDIRNYEK